MSQGKGARARRVAKRKAWLESRPYFGFTCRVCEHEDVMHFMFYGYCILEGCDCGSMDGVVKREEEQVTSSDNDDSTETEVEEYDPIGEYLRKGAELRQELIAEIGQEAFDASQHWVNNPLITPINKVAEFDKAIEREGREAYGEGIAWERKRVEMAWFLEMACDCDDAMVHLKQRIDEETK